MAKPMLAALKDSGWECWQEVRMQYGYPVADIIGLQGPLILNVEVKRSLSLSVIAQAQWWQEQYADFAYVCTPSVRSSRSSALASRILSSFGIGRFVVELGQAREVIAAKIKRHKSRFQRSMRAELRERLAEMPQAFADAGSSQGGYWTPFKRTARAVLDCLRKRGESSLAEVIAHVEHHYSTDGTATSCLRRYLAQGVIKGVESRREGRTVLYKLKEGM